MFSPLSKAAAVAVLICGGLLWVQTQRLERLQADNREQQQLIDRQQQTINQLNANAIQNRHLLNDIIKSENQQRDKTDEILNTITDKDKDSACYRAVAPTAVIEFLQQQ